MGVKGLVKKVVYFNLLNLQHAHNNYMLATNIRSVLEKECLFTCLLLLLLFFLSALSRVVPDSKPMLPYQGPGMSIRTMCMRICIRVRSGTHRHLHVYMYI